MKPTLTNAADVKRKCEYFVDVQVWPLTQTLNPQGWLQNFSEAELPHAAALLNSFLFFSEPLVDAIYESAFGDLVAYLRESGDTAFAIETKWRMFRQRVILTYSTGEIPSPTDSGLVFARKARQILKIAEQQIVPPERALELLAMQNRPVVFVDDFVGTGNQFVETWERPNFSGALKGIAFSDVSKHDPNSQIMYCPLVCTVQGAQRIRQACSRAILAPAHELDDRYSVFSADSITWPEGLQQTSEDFLRGASKRAGIPDDVNSTEDWRGFNQLGMSLAFFHSVPDATLPLFYWDANGWTPLIRRG